MFEGFESYQFDTGEAKIYARIGGHGSTVVLLHGYPQSHVCWHKIAPDLAKSHQVIAIDLRGYGDSRGPVPDVENKLYSKRAMAADVARVLDEFGIGHTAIVGHDRGGRVAYRFALDYPDRTERLVVLDMVPTSEMWGRLDAKGFIAGYHWPFLAQPGGLPERMIGHDSDDYLRHTLQSWTAVEGCFTDEAMAEYLRCFRNPAMIAASCADYRAGATVDWEIDCGDRVAGNLIGCPTLALWGDRRGRLGVDHLEVWRTWCSGPVDGKPIRCGHFLPEENPRETLSSLRPFLAA